MFFDWPRSVLKKLCWYAYLLFYQTRFKVTKKYLRDYLKVCSRLVGTLCCYTDVNFIKFFWITQESIRENVLLYKGRTMSTIFVYQRFRLTLKNAYQSAPVSSFYVIFFCVAFGYPKRENKQNTFVEFLLARISSFKM